MGTGDKLGEYHAERPIGLRTVASIRCDRKPLEGFEQRKDLKGSLWLLGGEQTIGGQKQGDQ